MFSTVLSATLHGLAVEFIDVEADVSNGLPMFHLVGYLSSEVKEAGERVRTAIRNAGFVILADFESGGYFKSNDPDELRQFTRTMNAKARNTLRALESAERALDAATGQQRMKGWW